MALTEARPRLTTRSGPGFAYMMTGIAVGCICVSGVLASIFTPDLVTGVQHQHTPIAAWIGWIFDMAAIAMVAPTAIKGIRGKVTDRAPWILLGLGVGAIWLAVMFISIFTPVSVTGTDPTKVPIGGFISAVAGIVLTGLLCKMVKTTAFEPVEAQPGPETAVPMVGPEPAANDAATKLRRLAQLRDSGVITEADFEAKKDDLLSRI